MSMESHLGLLAIHAYFEAMGLGSEYVETLHAALDQVTPADIQRAAIRYLRDLFVLALMP